MVLRNATLDDLESIYQVHVKSIKTLCQEHYSDAQIESWTGILSPGIYESALRDKIFMVAQHDDGTIRGLGIMDSAAREISAIYVDPEYAGQSIGRKLLAEFEHIAAAKEISRLTVRSTLNAKGFYLKYGYAGDKSTTHELPNGLRLECVEMEKSLK